MTPIYNLGSVLAASFRNCVSSLPPNLGKVSKVALPALALLTGLAFYFYWTRPQRPNITQVAPPPPRPTQPEALGAPKAAPLLPVEQRVVIQPLSPVGQQAIAHAEGLLLSRPDIEEHKFKMDEPPQNPDINKLITLTNEKYKALRALKTAQRTPEQDDEMLKLTDEYMIIAFAICIKILEEMNFKSDNNKNLNLDSLTVIDSSKIKIAILYAQKYRGLKKHNTDNPTVKKTTFYPDNKIPSAQSFYTEGTLQNKWRTLQNEFRTQLEVYVGKEELEQSKNFSIMCLNDWTKRDDFPGSWDPNSPPLPWE